jgi:hypothetical protein
MRCSFVAHAAPGGRQNFASSSSWIAAYKPCIVLTMEPAVIELDRQEFARVVRGALRACDRPDLLLDHPLLASRWLAARAGVTRDRLAASRALSAALRDECRHLFASPRDQILDRVMEHTFFRPPGKQQRIAAELGLAYSTYRRYLAHAVARLADALRAQMS